MCVQQVHIRHPFRLVHDAEVIERRPPVVAFLNPGESVLDGAWHSEWAIASVRGIVYYRVTSSARLLLKRLCLKPAAGGWGKQTGRDSRALHAGGTQCHAPAQV
jgi:hypothetical protein